jgi:hypothetical protein
MNNRIAHKVLLLITFVLCAGAAAFHRQLHISSAGEAAFIAGAAISFLEMI